MHFHRQQKFDLNFFQRFCLFARNKFKLWEKNWIECSTLLLREPKANLKWFNLGIACKAWKFGSYVLKRLKFSQKVNGSAERARFLVTDGGVTPSTHHPTITNSKARWNCCEIRIVSNYNLHAFMQMLELFLHSYCRGSIMEKTTIHVVFTTDV